MKEFANKTNADLEKLLTDKRESLRKFHFNISGSKTRNVKEGRELRRADKY